MDKFESARKSLVFYAYTALPLGIGTVIVAYCLAVQVVFGALAPTYNQLTPESASLFWIYYLIMFLIYYLIMFLIVLLVPKSIIYLQGQKPHRMSMLAYFILPVAVWMLSVEFWTVSICWSLVAIAGYLELFALNRRKA